MSSLTRVVLPIAALVGLVFVTTFVMNYTSTAPDLPTTQTPTASGEGPALSFPRQQSSWPYTRELRGIDPADDSIVGDSEVHVTSHYDFWFVNRLKEKVAVTLKASNCSCQEVRIALVPSDAQQQAEALGMLAGVPGVGQTHPAGLLQLLMLSQMWDAVDRNGNWFTFSMNDLQKSFTVPPLDETRGPSLGVLRMYWTGRAPEQKRLTAQILTQLPNQNAVAIDFLVVTNIVPAFRASTGVLNLGDIDQNQHRSGEFILFTTTRPTLNLGLQVLGKPSKCFEVDGPYPIPAAEYPQLEQQLTPAGAPRPKITAAYRIPVKLRESTADERLDQGPFARRIEVVGDAGKLMLTVQAQIRGDIRLIGAAADAEYQTIRIGNFLANAGATKTVFLESTRPGLKLVELPGERSEHLKVQLEPDTATGNSGRWRLTITVPGGVFNGELPSNCGVVLQTNDTPPRRIRIPVVGNAQSR